MVKDEDHDDIVSELVAQLHSLYAMAVDTGGQTEEENEQILEDARLLLGRHGVEV
jgi:hypothetical protein